MESLAVGHQLILIFIILNIVSTFVVGYVIEYRIDKLLKELKDER